MMYFSLLSIAFILFGILCDPAFARSKSAGLTEYDKAVMSTPAPGEDKRNKQKNIHSLLILQNIENNAIQIVEQIMDLYAKKLTVNQKDQIYKKVLKELDYEELITILSPVYETKFSNAELKQILEFYKTPAGNKLVKFQTSMFRESSSLIQQWSEKIHARINTLVKDLEKTQIK